MIELPDAVVKSLFKNKMSDFEDLPDIDYECNTKNIVMELESDESDIEVVWEGNNSQTDIIMGKNPSTTEEVKMYLPGSSSSVPSNSRSIKATKSLNPPPLLISDSDPEEECIQVMLPKKKRKPKILLTKDAEKKRLEKDKEREMKRLEKEKRQEEERRKAEMRQTTKEVQKSTKPGGSCMTIILDFEISQKFDALVPLLVSADVKYEILSDPVIDNSILFKRNLIRQTMGDDLKIKLRNQSTSGSKDNEENSLDLTTWVESIKAVLLGKHLTLFLMDMEKYFRKIKKTTQKEFRTRVLDTDNNPVPNKRKQKQNLPYISQAELYGTLIEMQLQTGVNYRLVKNVNELGSTLVNFVKAIADAPHKKQEIETDGSDLMEFFDVSGSIKVEKDGTGLKQLWVDQLQQFSTVGSDVAQAISKRFPSPMALLKAYNSCDNQEQGESLLTELPVITGVGPLERIRKVGSENSKILYRFFTSTNGSRLLGSAFDT
ncbi:crossover junction endonuclease EME1 isoform X2 [Folsomia candida]|uniref:crossover junction endonuclease EME1 isoform X2 n=1 Tax=Folsomia candida TaxID=158441 RepID=UPI001604A369|nr:crossover junction endonuclease EME1 isoform X2 [Folsomia candida]